MVKNVDEWIYVWKIPVGKSFSYIVGMEKSPGSRNDEYLNKIWNAVTKMPSLRSKFEPLKDNNLFVPIRRRTHHTYKWTEDKINATEGIQFETKEEKENFVASLDTWIYKWLNKFPEGENSARVPYLGDYTKEWTDVGLYEYFNLTEEEIKEIEQEIK